MMLLLVVAMLTTIYVSALGSFTWQDVALGFGVSGALIWAFRGVTVRHHLESNVWTARTLAQSPRYIGRVFWDIVTGTWQVTTYVIGLKQLSHPGIIRIPYEEESRVRLGVALIAISLSPGSFVVDVNEEERFVLCHFIDISDPDRLRNEIHRKYLHVPGTHTIETAQEGEQPSHA
jgi:multisubunit Na+/H+ antiporter MnhE subunit